MRTLKRGLKKRGLKQQLYFLGRALLCLSMACPYTFNVCEDCDNPECEEPDGCLPPPECEEPEWCDKPAACNEGNIPEGFPGSLVSIGKRTVTSSGGSAPMLVDGKFRDSAAWTANAGDWVSIEVGEGIQRLLLSWTSSGNYDHPEIRYGAPASYRIETSGDSTNGMNGGWTEVLTVDNNHVRTRAHSIPFEGQRWLRFVVLSQAGTETANGGVGNVRIDEIELHDNSDEKVEGWFFLGDSITAGAFMRASFLHPAFATWLWAADPSRYPLQMNGGYGGDTAREPASSLRQHSLERLKQALDENDGIHVVAIALGTNDFGDMDGYRTNMRAMVEEVQSRGKIAVIPRIPWSAAASRPEAAQEAMNRVVDELTEAFGLPKGPDFYAHFKANPHHLLGEEAPEWSRPDWLHPNVMGNKAINCLWAEAAKAVPKP